MKYRAILPCLACCFAALLFGKFPVLLSQETPPEAPQASETPAPETPTPPTETPAPETPNATPPTTANALVIPPEKMTPPLSLQVLGYNMYSQLAMQADSQGGGNICFSPQLLAKQLTALRFGADGQTATEIFNAFPARAIVPQTSGFLQQIDASAAKIPEGAQHPQVIPTFGLANAIWVPTDHPIVEQYVNGLKTGLATDLYAADFKNQRDAAATVINAWVRDTTGGRLTSVIAEPYEVGLPGEISVVTTGLVCAAPRLVVPFNQKFSVSNEFHLVSGEKISVPMMRQIGPYYYAEVTSLQILMMPCVEENLRLILLLPAEGQLKTLEKLMTPDFLQQQFTQLKPMNVDVIMPQLKTTACLDLTETLKNMGMATISTEKADLKNMSQAVEKGPLHLSKFMHATQMTIVEQINNPQQQVPQTQKQFYVNRPFVFLLWNTASSTPLVIGRVTNPQL